MAPWGCQLGQIRDSRGVLGDMLVKREKGRGRPPTAMHLTPARKGRWCAKNLRLKGGSVKIRRDQPMVSHMSEETSL